jgi:[acyl-carrier-protein] S-malonyltransferase
LAAQLTGSVRWTASMKAAVQAGATHFIEIGPGEVLAGLMKRIEREAKRFSVHDGESVRAIAGVLKEQRQG